MMMMMTTTTMKRSPAQQSNMPVPVVDKRRRLDDEQIRAALSTEIVAHHHFALNDSHHQVVGAYVRNFTLDQQDAFVSFSSEPDLNVILTLACQSLHKINNIVTASIICNILVKIITTYICRQQW